MATVVFINRLQPTDAKRDALIGHLREFADSIHADPESLFIRCRDKASLESAISKRPCQRHFRTFGDTAAHDRFTVRTAHSPR